MTWMPPIEIPRRRAGSTDPPKAKMALPTQRTEGVFVFRDKMR